MGLISFTPQGMYCEAGDFYLDPHRKVKRALITHGHADHARPGHSAYLCADKSVPILQHRLGRQKPIKGLAFGESISIRGVKVSFHPAGHIAGSAQIRLEHKGEIWVLSGDYKVENDGFSEAFEPISCHTFITECTFGLPVYRWQSQETVIEEINAWWRANQADGICSLLLGYSLGKSQRLLASIDTEIGKVYTHRTIHGMNKALRAAGWKLPKTTILDKKLKREEFAGSLVLAPSSILNSKEFSQIQPLSVGNASGWMALRSTSRRSNIDRGFVLSDHADWPGLLSTIKATDATCIIAAHGYTSALSQYLREQGYEAYAEEEMKAKHHTQ